MFEDLGPGDMVWRYLGGHPMRMIVREIRGDIVVCDALQQDWKTFPGGWEFDRKTGLEEDHELGWGVRFGVTGSYLSRQGPN